MGIINVLDAQVANMIAAGEVVERPSSAMKELIENSIDAGAKHITAEIKNGGVSFMRVSDDGCGMSREDVPVSILRHATSKIHEKKDLDGITTLGFRGEALAAIASVSHLRIITKTKDSQLGILLDSKAGNILSIEETGCPDGTTIIVEELFENVPARKKFLKRDLSEANAVAAVMEKLALSHPEISIRFISDGKLKYVTSGDGDLKSIIYAVLGKNFANNMAPVHDMTEGIEITGYIGTPENIKGTHNYQNFFINGRYIKSTTASAAVDQAFKSYIPSEKFPCCVLNMNIHPAFVDVNVHPSKLEVKFSNESAIFNAVYCSVRNALMNNVARPSAPDSGIRRTSDDYKIFSKVINEKLESADVAKAVADEVEALKTGYEQIEMNTYGKYVPPVVEPDAPHKDNASAKNESKTDHTGSSLNITEGVKDIPDLRISTPFVTDERGAGLSSDRDSFHPHGSQQPDSYKSVAQQSNQYHPEKETKIFNASLETPHESVKYKDDELGSALYQGIAEMIKSPSAESGTDSAVQSSPGIEKQPAAFSVGLSSGTDDPSMVRTEIPWYKIIGTAFNCYIFVELKDKMMVIDKHAAHERILFENMRKTLQNRKNISQILMIPVEIPLSGTAFAAVSENADSIRSVGYDFTTDDKKSNIIELIQIPSGLEISDAAEAFEALAEKLADGTGVAKTEIHDLYEKALYQASCKAAVKGGRNDSEEHMKWICDMVLSHPEIKFCPHGRPVAFEISKHQLGVRFDRL